jgi:integrase
METIKKCEAWNKGKLVGQKPPLKPKDIWAIRIHLQHAHAIRDLAMFNLAIDSKLRGCDLVSLRVRDITHGNQVLSRAMVIQRKTQRPVQFELTEPTRVAVTAWLEKSRLRGDQFLFPSRVAKSPHISTRQYARIVHHWAESAGLDSSAYGTHSMRRTKAPFRWNSIGTAGNRHIAARFQPKSQGRHWLVVLKNSVKFAPVSAHDKSAYR